MLCNAYRWPKNQTYYWYRVTRTVNNLIVDEFPEFMVHHNKEVENTGLFLVDRKAKKCWSKFCQFAREKIKIKKPARPDIPNQTHELGMCNMFYSMLILCPLLLTLQTDLFFSRFFCQHNLEITNLEWIQMAEYEVVLEVLHMMVMESQQEGVVQVFFNWYAIVEAWSKLWSFQELSVINTQYATFTEDLPWIKMPCSQLIPTTTKLLQWADKEIRYGPKICNPLAFINEIQGNFIFENHW